MSVFRRTVRLKAGHYVHRCTIGPVRNWRALGAAVAIAVVVIPLGAALLTFLAPDLSYQLEDRLVEFVSGKRSHTYRIALGARTGSNFRVGTVLNAYLKARAGYELELVETSVTGNVETLLDGGSPVDFAAINSADEAAAADGVYGIAALESQYFYVVVPASSPVQEFRDIGGPLNPGTRATGQPPTLGERVLDYYALGSRVPIVRPANQGIAADFQTGRMVAMTRTQFLRSELIEAPLSDGQYRLVPIRDNEALARAIPGTHAAVIPAGLFGPERRIPPEPVPTIAVTQLLVARGDVPARVIRDVLEAIYDPRFARDLRYKLTEQSGRTVGALPLHPAADIYYRRNDVLTSERLGRVSFVASALAGLVAAVQFVGHYRRGERVRARRRRLINELHRLESIRDRIDEATDPESLRDLLRQADTLLSSAEQEAAADQLDADGIRSIRSLHHLCWRAMEQRAAAVRSVSLQIGGGQVS